MNKFQALHPIRSWFKPAFIDATLIVTSDPAWQDHRDACIITLEFRLS